MTKPRQVTFTAGVKIKAAAGEAKHRRFSIEAYTGGPLNVDAFDLPIYIDLDGLYWSRERRPCLYDHEPTKENLVGQLDHIRIEAGSLWVDGFFLKSTAVGREVQGIAEDGYEWQASVGADPEAIEEVHEGQTGVVNGRTVQGPCLISRKTNLGEVSFVVMGADDRTNARITARMSRARRIRGQGSQSMDEFEKYLSARGFKAEDLNENQLAALRADFEKSGEHVDAEGEESDVEAEGDDEEVTADGEETDVAAEGEEEPVKSRAKAGRKTVLVKAGGKALKSISAAARDRAKELRRLSWIQKACQGHPEIEAKALENGWSVDKTKLEVIRAARPQAPHAQTRDRINAKAIEASLLLSAGVPEDRVAKSYDQKAMNQATERDLRGITLHYVMDRVIEASGDHFRGNRKSDSFIRAALNADRQIRAAGGFTTVSLASVLENVANKALIASYEAVETVWANCCAARSHGDFKIHSRVRLDAQGAFRKVGADGELKHVGLSDAKFTNQLDTHGAIISLTRQMQYNDDLGAFLELPKMLGRMAALSVEEAFFLLLLSNPGNFFHANNRNLTSGAGSALSISGLTALEQKFRDQVDSNGKPVLMSPQVLLVPTSLKTEADNLFEEVTVNETTTTDKAKPARNPHKGRFKPVTSPYLNNTSLRVLDENDQPTAISGQSSTGYYLFADPNVRAAFAVAFLNGVQTPTVESAETDFTTLGMQWRSFFDFGVGTEDPVAAAKALGT